MPIRLAFSLTHQKGKKTGEGAARIDADERRDATGSRSCQQQEVRGPSVQALQKHDPPDISAANQMSKHAKENDRRK